MPKFIIIALISVLFATSGHASESFTYYANDSYSVGKTPIKVMKLEGDSKLHIFCAGEDLNYNDIIDQGDEAPSWWILDSPNGIARKVLDFDKFLKYRPFRPALDPASNMLYVPLVGKIVSLSLDDEVIDDDMLASIDAQSINFAGGHLLITVSPSGFEIGKVEVFNLQTSQILQTVTGGKNISDCIYYPSQKGISIAILNQGEYGSDSSTVMYGPINHMFDFELEDEVVVGNAGNHILQHEGKLYVTVNLSHWIKVIDLNTHEVQTWNTGTTGWDGPRESVIRGDKLFVTTYSGDVRTFDINTGLLIDIYSNNLEKIENLAFYDDNSFFSTNTYDELYSPNNQIDYWTKEPGIFPGMMKEFTVGKAPVGLIYESWKRVLHVFCQGDKAIGEAPSWWTIEQHNDADFNIFKRYEFGEDDIKMPFLPAIDEPLGTLYIPAKGAIKSYNIDEFTIDNDLISGLDAVALNMAGSHLMAAVRYENQADSVVVINLQTGSILQKVYAGNNVVDLKYFSLFKEGSQQPVISLSILTNDGEDDQNSKLLYGPINHMLSFSLDNEVSVGVGATNIAIGTNNMIAVASHSSDDLFVLNAEKNTLSNIKLGTQGAPFGPLTVGAVEDFGVIVGTGAGNITSVDVSNNEMGDDYKLTLGDILPIGFPVVSSVIEVDMESFSSYLAVTGPKDMSGNVNDKVVIFTTGITSVREYKNGEIAAVKIFPNPSNEFINVETRLRENANSEVSLEIYSITGSQVVKINLPSSLDLNYTFNIRDLGLTSGTYILHILNGSEVKAVPFNVVR